MQLPLKNRPGPAIVAFDGSHTPRELARGLAWVRWLLQSVRSRCERLAFDPDSSSPEDLLRCWAGYAGDTFSARLAPWITEAWQCAARGDQEGLCAVDRALEEWFDAETSQRSRKAGEVLMKSTKGARYQGVLGKLRLSHATGATPGHFLTVWAAVGNFFQLSLAGVLAEYLRLEWELGVRDAGIRAEPGGACGFTNLVGRAMQAGTLEPAIVKRG